MIIFIIVAGYSGQSGSALDDLNCNFISSGIVLLFVGSGLIVHVYGKNIEKKTFPFHEFKVTEILFNNGKLWIL